MKKYFPILVSIFVLANLFSCKVGDDTGQIVRDFYTFDELFTLTNVKKTYQVNDFVFLEYNLPDKMMTDVTTGQTLLVGNATMLGSLNIFDPFDVDADATKFSFSTVDGNVTDDEDFEKSGLLKFNIGCPASTEYKLKINLAFLEPGGYLLYPNFLQETPYLEFAFTDEADCASVAFPNVSDEADFGTVQFFLDVDDVNRDEFDAYAAGFPDFPTEDYQRLATALEEKRAFFVRVE